MESIFRWNHHFRRSLDPEDEEYTSTNGLLWTIIWSETFQCIRKGWLFNCYLRTFLLQLFRTRIDNYRRNMLQINWKSVRKISKNAIYIGIINPFIKDGDRKTKQIKTWKSATLAFAPNFFCPKALNNRRIRI